MKIIHNPFLINNCLKNAHLFTGLTHFVRKYNSFYICHTISEFYTFIMQIHFYLFIGGGKKWRLKNTTHVVENISSHWLIFYTHASTKNLQRTNYWKEIQFMFIQAGFHNEDTLKPITTIIMSWGCQHIASLFHSSVFTIMENTY